MLQQLLENLDIVQKLDALDDVSIWQSAVDLVHIAAIYRFEASHFESVHLRPLRQACIDSIKSASSLHQILVHHCAKSIVQIELKIQF
jgi:hypothetical protein